METIYLTDYKVPAFLIETVDLEIRLGEAHTLVTATLKIKKNSDYKPLLSDIELMGKELDLISVALDGRQLDQNQYIQTSESLKILNVPESFILSTAVKIKPQENTALSGLYKSSGNFCTQCEAEGFRRITYYLDRPDVMAIFTTTIIADKKQYPILLSNGNLVEKGDLEANQHYVVWKDPFKKPSYLFALVAGQLDYIEDKFVTMSGREVTLQIFVEKGNIDKCAHAMEAVKKAMLWDEENYGREYDLDIYMIVAVSDFNMGAMENKGLNIFNTKYILARPETATDYDYIHVEGVIAHEYFHNWTGNRITCRDWFQLSLKEGLTVFRDQSFTSDTTSKTFARIADVNELRNSQFLEDAGPLAHPVRPDSYVEINNFYTSTIYNKGAEVIRMQQILLGKNLFRKGMDLYFERHDGQAVTIEDFVKAMEAASGKSLQQFRLWYIQAGTPALEVKDYYNPKKQRYTLSISQTCRPTPEKNQKDPFHIPIKLGLIDSAGQEILNTLIELTEQTQDFHFENIKQKPVPSLLREFSAPVKLTYNYTDADLQLLMKHDTDLFNRWEAGQRYALHLILQLIQDLQQNKSLTLPADYVATIQYLLQEKNLDKLFLAELLTLPSEKYISEHLATIDVEAVHFAREFVMFELATQLKKLFLNLYEANKSWNENYQFNMAAVGKRRITQLCLNYLYLLDDENIFENIIVTQFNQSLICNMTDTMATLHCIANTDHSQRARLLQKFYDQWQNEPLIVNKWLAIQATSKLEDTLDQVKMLTSHPAFDIKNPNKVYDLIAAFVHRNPYRFHAADGSGYVFLSDMVLRIDKLNPQVAARIVKALSDWKRYDASRQRLMHQQLQYILKNATSNDVKELVTKSL